MILPTIPPVSAKLPILNKTAIYLVSQLINEPNDPLRAEIIKYPPV